ncbi:MAG: type II toxin-antitoxin system HicB family antitoxin [Candidatus Tectomicrobia bacterium]|uniref:Type II toxin-antitoxin system HicB family antitoxin n=1 Tax=Tectimicrobiota bacterium TaxID=2528274 RepID=A0A933LPX1_UNCTE|nr:type II toxin-antitoxin system HicB family antitoxin [Candidatus Tectomicrobia bacterium]
MTVKTFSLIKYIEAALKLAEYEHDESGMIIASIPEVSGFYAQGDNHEEARDNLKDVIENTILLRIQLGWDIPAIPGVIIREENVETHTA